MGCVASAVSPSDLPETIFCTDFNLFLLRSRREKDKVDFVSRYKGKVLLIMNFNPRDRRFAESDINNLVEVVKMLEKSKRTRGRMHILLFPSDDFSDPLVHKEWQILVQKSRNWVPGVDPDIAKQCHWLSTRGNVDIFFPVPCSGRSKCDFWKYLSQKLPGKPSYLPYRDAASIKWDFTKFLVDAEGKPVYRFEAWTSVMDIFDSGCMFPLLEEVSLKQLNVGPSVGPLAQPMGGKAGMEKTDVADFRPYKKTVIANQIGGRAAKQKWARARTATQATAKLAAHVTGKQGVGNNLDSYEKQGENVRELHLGIRKPKAKMAKAKTLVIGKMMALHAKGRGKNPTQLREEKSVFPNAEGFVCAAF